MLLHHVLTVVGSTDWEPVTLPFPGDGLTVRQSFLISSPGTFDIHVETASADSQHVGMEELPPAVCALRVTISQENGFLTAKTITALRRHSLIGFGHIDIYESNETFDLPRRGEYTIELSSKADVPVFAHHGGVVHLSRYQTGIVEQIIMYHLERIAAYIILFLSTIGILVSTRKKKAQRVA
jgi:hypothetical protein